jgi:hypothetical protein
MGVIFLYLISFLARTTTNNAKNKYPSNLSIATKYIQDPFACILAGIWVVNTIVLK